MKQLIDISKYPTSIREEIPVNPELNLEIIVALIKKAEADTLTCNDLERIDFYLSCRADGLNNYILRNFKSHGIESYAHYLLEKTKPREMRNRWVDGICKGTILGSLEVLSDFLKHKK